MDAWERYVKLHKINTFINYRGEKECDLFVVVPCFNEPDICTILKDLNSCARMGQGVGVVVVVNSGVQTPNGIKAQNRETYQELVRFLNENTFSNIQLYPVHVEDIPKKHSGVGYARKIGMDFCIGYFYQKKIRGGILVSLDADCRVETNFLSEVLKAYQKHPKLGLTLHYFEHDLTRKESLPYITEYEMYLRYFRLAQYYAGFPYAIHTIGSCFSVLADIYVKHGGMNRKQGGEDFYFLHKIAPHVQYKTLSTTTVHPSSRFSDRVPFGTGPALAELESSQNELRVYDPDSFELLKAFFNTIPYLYKLTSPKVEEVLVSFPSELYHFLQQLKFVERVGEANRNSATEHNFEKRMFQFFDGFKMIKFLNISHQTHFEKLPIREATRFLLGKMQLENIEEYLKDDLLLLLRFLDRCNKYE